MGKGKAGGQGQGHGQGKRHGRRNHSTGIEDTSILRHRNVSISIAHKPLLTVGPLGSWLSCRISSGAAVHIYLVALHPEFYCALRCAHCQVCKLLFFNL